MMISQPCDSIIGGAAVQQDHQPDMRAIAKLKRPRDGVAGKALMKSRRPFRSQGGDEARFVPPRMRKTGEDDELVR
jgi:hypothetical protein